MKSTSNSSQTELYTKINNIKAELTELSQTFGMVHELTVAKSQELDCAVNEYMISHYKTLTSAS